MKRYIPRKGTTFEDREELEDKLVKSGWEFEGTGHSRSKGKVTSYDVGVMDRKGDIWLMVHLVPVVKGIKVVKVEKLRLSDYSK